MLINALCDYYDILAKAGKVLPDGYSNVNVHYLVALTEDGKIDEIINWQKKVSVGTKGKERQVPREIVLPKRTEKPGIDANIIEHRPLYLFGLNYVDDGFSAEDQTQKAKKSHEVFVQENLTFLEGLDSPLIQAYRKFVENWNPADEVANKNLLGLGKDYGKSGFAFCLSGHPESLLHEDILLKEKWDRGRREAEKMAEDSLLSQCAVCGETAPIARIHDKIKGVVGGNATGTVLISYKNPAETSYGNTQSYNSNISERVMQKYTETLNYLLNGMKHKALLDDLTVVFWAMNASETCEDLFTAMLWGQSEKITTDEMDELLRKLLRDARDTRILEERMIDPDVDFYMIGLKPNSSRLALKFIYRKKYAQILHNITRYQAEMQISAKPHTIPLWSVKKSLVSPKSKNEVPDPALISKLLEAIFHGTPYPVSLLSTMVRRARTDREIDETRAGMIKACLNRNYLKEELKVALDRENHDQAYVCGRLFAVLERLQQSASKMTLNRTIKEAYFASASATPALVFPKFIKLSQSHLNKLENPVYFNKLIGEVISILEGKFPETLTLIEQGTFMIGYYQQYQRFFEKRENA